MLKKIALAVLLLCKAATAQNTTALEPGQVYSTGNLVNWTAPNTTAPTTSTTSPWINGVYSNTLCFYAGDPGNCGPNPTVRSGSINFSYGLTDIYQVTSVAAALPNSGTGLNVNGYNFGFMAKNGNGWDDGRQDYLTAYVRFYGSNGSTVRDDFYNLNYKFDWTYFNLSKTFDTPYASKDLTAAQYGFVGRDNNFWAGNYGPEITNISFSLKYSVDPCATNPMYSPTCPGYLDALAKLVPQTTVVADPIVSTVTDPVASVTSTTTSTSSTSIIGQTSIVAPIVSAPAPTTTVSTTSSPTQKESSGSSNTSLALSIISKNSDRDAAGSAVAQAAVSQAQTAATQAQQEAASVAASAVANSTTANAVTVGSQQSSGNGIRINNNNNSNSTNFTLQSGVTSLVTSVGGPQTTNNNTASVQQQNSSGLGLNVSNNQPVIVTNIGTQQSSTSESVTTFALPLLQPQQPVASVVAPTVFSSFEQPQVQQQTMLQSSSITSQSTETYAVVPSNFLTDRSNPLTDIVEGKNTVPQNSTIATTGPSVNRNSSDNEVAGGVDLNKMALAPVGYGDYLNLTLRDAAFYAPKEVYKNQRNVDNVRVLRQLSSDSKHREMVEMQYAK
jgi:hypothetical protein